MSARSKQAAGRVQVVGTAVTVAWPGKRAASHVATRDLTIGPGKRSRTQSLRAAPSRTSRTIRTK